MGKMNSILANKRTDSMNKVQKRHSTISKASTVPDLDERKKVINTTMSPEAITKNQVVSTDPMGRRIMMGSQT